MYFNKSKILKLLLLFILIFLVSIILLILLKNNNIETINIYVGDNIEMEKLYNNINKNSKNLEFYSSDQNIVTIDKETGSLFAKKVGEATITIKSKNSLFIKKRYIVKVEEKKELSWIKFDKTNYTCKVGDVFDTMIKTGGEKISSIKEFKSSDESMAIISPGTKEGNYTKCIDCMAVHVTCKKEGSVNLIAISSIGEQTSSTLIIEK